MSQHVTPKPKLGLRFHRLILSSGFANLADGIGVVAWPWLASLITRDPLAIALVGVAQKLPWFLFALPSGVIADRFDRRRIVAAMDFARFFALMGFAAAMLIPGLLPVAPEEGFPLDLLYGLMLLSALIVGFCEVLRDNSAVTLLPAIVPQERLEGANGRLGSVEIVMNMMIGPPLAGVLIGLALPFAFGLYGIAFAFAGLLVLSIPGRYRTERAVKRHWVSEIGEGAAFLFARPLLRDLAFSLGIYNAVESMMMIALVLYAQEVMGLNAAQYGLLLTSLAAGGLVGGVFGEAIIARLGASVALRLGIVTCGLFALVTLLCPYAILVWIILFVASVAAMVWNIITLSLRQRVVPPHLLGRVSSVYRFFGLGTLPLGVLISGLSVSVAETLMPRPLALAAPFAIGAVMSVLLLAVMWRRVAPQALAEFRPA
ncbi:MFS transporter [Rhizobium sp. AAP43]|uniref:MFS transporter n=1 Tax=Rhizobium sp. AAP43 TaxID=1523420 RepID=UPI0006B93601|nr:MFS transporter [Rhizobium sp. AAP43]